MPNIEDKVLMVADITKCSGCEICELVCSMRKSGAYRPSVANIKVMRNEELAVSIPTTSAECELCGTCVEWCPTKVLRIVTLTEAIKLRKESEHRRAIPVMMRPVD